MNHTANTRGYDLFKAIITLILIILLIWLIFRSSATSTPFVAASTEFDTPTSTQSVLTLVEPTATSLPAQPSPTVTLLPTEASIPTPSPTATPTTEELSAEVPTSIPQPTVQPTESEAPAQVPADCPLALPTRLMVGDTVRVTSNLNMRTGAGILEDLILTNLAGTQLTIIGGPVCEPYQGGAYLWWQVLRSDDQSGWSAEGSSTGNFYFLEPVE